MPLLREAESLQEPGLRAGEWQNEAVIPWGRLRRPSDCTVMSPADEELIGGGGGWPG
jgi:hypothetical protein